MNKRNGHKQIEHYEATTDYLIFPILYSLVKSRRLNKNAESFPSLYPKMLTPCFKNLCQWKQDLLPMSLGSGLFY